MGPMGHGGRGIISSKMGWGIFFFVGPKMGPNGPRSAGPCGPWGPWGPWGPCGHVGPLGPVGSIGPIGPTVRRGRNLYWVKTFIGLFRLLDQRALWVFWAFRAFFGALWARWALGPALLFWFSWSGVFCFSWSGVFWVFDCLSEHHFPGQPFFNLGWSGQH